MNDYELTEDETRDWLTVRGLLLDSDALARARSRGLPFLPLTTRHLEGHRRTLELILDDLDGWNQSNWGQSLALNDQDEVDRWLEQDPTAPAPCGTAFCYAGTYAVRVAGATPIWDRPLLPGTRLREMISVRWIGPDGQWDISSVALFANRGLGLSRYEHTLWASGISLRRLTELVCYWTGGRVDLIERATQTPRSEPLRRDDARNETADSDFFHATCRDWLHENETVALGNREWIERTWSLEGGVWSRVGWSLTRVTDEAIAW